MINMLVRNLLIKKCRIFIGTVCYFSKIRLLVKWSFLWFIRNCHFSKMAMDFPSFLVCLVDQRYVWAPRFYLGFIKIVAIATINKNMSLVTSVLKIFWWANVCTQICQILLKYIYSIFPFGSFLLCFRMKNKYTLIASLNWEDVP